VLLFVFYQFEPAPVYFNTTAWEQAKSNGTSDQLTEFEKAYAAAHEDKTESIRAWLAAERAGDAVTAETARSAAMAARERSQAIRTDAIAALQQTNERAKAEDYDYVFITFVLDFLPHGLIGLLMAVFFAAALSSLAAELSALGETTNVDFYRFVIRREEPERHYVSSSRWLTVFWGVVAIGFALFANQQENLIEAINIVGSLFYGVVLGMFCVAFFVKHVGSWAIFWGAIASQSLIFALFFSGVFDFSYLYYNMIGCVGCVVLSVVLQFAVRGRQERVGA
jgi:SSS family solute:Na+ symporter